MLKNFFKKTYFIIIGAASVLIWIASATDAIEKTISYYDKIKLMVSESYLFTDNHLNELLEKYDELLKIQEKDRDYSKLNSLLRTILSKDKKTSLELDECISENNNLTVLKQKDIVIVSTNNQYKSKGFILFIDRYAGSVIFKETKFDSGITGVKFINSPDAKSPSFFVVKYITITGSGTFGESVAFYALYNHNITLALQKPYYEMNSGWGAFQSDTIELKSKNELEINNSNLYLKTTGIAVYGEDMNKFEKLPNEIYLWNSKDLLFEQVKGRTTSDKELMTDIYSDFAKPKGNWFSKPTNIDKTKLIAAFSDEQW